MNHNVASNARAVDTAPDNSQVEVSFKMALGYVKDISITLDKILAVATVARIAEEAKGEDRANLCLIALFQIIAELAEDWTCISGLTNILEAADKKFKV